MVISGYQGERGKSFWYAGQMMGVDRVVVTTRNQCVVIYDTEGYVDLVYPEERIQHGPSCAEEVEK